MIQRSVKMRVKKTSERSHRPQAVSPAKSVAALEAPAVTDFQHIIFVAVPFLKTNVYIRVVGQTRKHSHPSRISHHRTWKNLMLQASPFLELSKLTSLASRKGWISRIYVEVQCLNILNPCKSCNSAPESHGAASWGWAGLSIV